MSVFLCPHLMGIWVNCIVVEWKLISTGYCMIFAKMLSATFILCQHFTSCTLLEFLWGGVGIIYGHYIVIIYRRCTVIVCMRCTVIIYRQPADLHGLALPDFHSNTVVFEVSELNLVDKTKYYANGVHTERTRLQLIEQ
jgi:hypothetical protein